MRPRRAIVCLLLVLLLSLASFQPGTADTPGWSSQTVSSSRLNAVAFSTDGSVAWAVGDSGTLLKSTDGSTWTADTSISVGTSLRGVVLTDANHAYVVGASGTVLRMLDGTTWENVTSAALITTTINGIASAGSLLWAVSIHDDTRGTSIFFSGDGQTWTSGQNINVDAYGVAGLADGTVFVVGNSGTIARRSGGTWSIQVPTGSHLRAVSAVDATTAWAAALDGTVLRTTDGVTWSATTASPTSDALLAISATSTTTAWATSIAGRVYRTIDGGATWTDQSTGLGSVPLRAIVMRSSTNGWAVGDGGTILKTTTGGEATADTPTVTTTPTAASAPTATPVQSPTLTPSPTVAPSATPTWTRTATPTTAPTATGTVASTPSPSATFTVSATASPVPTSTATVSPRAPGTPTLTLSGQQLTVSWAAPSDLSVPLARYEVNRFPAGSEVPDETTQVSASTRQLVYPSFNTVGSFTFTVTAVYGVSSPQKFESGRSAVVEVTPSATPSATPLPSPTRTRTATPTWSPTPVVAASATAGQSSASATPTPTLTAVASPTSTGTAVASLTATLSPSATPSPTAWITPPATAIATAAPIQLTALPTTVPTPNPATGGAAALVPTAAAGTSGPRVVITPAPGTPFQYQLEVRPGPTPVGISVQPATELPAGVTLPPEVLVGKLLAIDVFDPSTGQVIHDHPVPLRLTLQLDELERAVCAVDPSRIAVLHVGAAGHVTRLTPTTVDCASGVISVDLRSTSQIAVAVLPNGAAIPYSLYLPLEQRRARLS